MNNKNPIQNRIAAHRAHKGIRQEALAQGLGIERTYFSRVERGRVTPSGALMASVCRWFALPLEGGTLRMWGVKTMKPAEIILNQMERLNAFQSEDPEQILVCGC